MNCKMYSPGAAVAVAVAVAVAAATAATYVAAAAPSEPAEKRRNRVSAQVFRFILWKLINSTGYPVYGSPKRHT